MAETTGSVGSEGVEMSDGGAGGIAAEGDVAAGGGAVDAVKADVAGSETGAGSGRSARSDESALPGAGAGRCSEEAGEEDDGGADGDGGDGGGDEAGGVDGGS
jgi:hypothetical protein